MNRGLVPVDGVAWCVTHDSPWYEGDLRCNDRPDSFGECVEVGLYREMVDPAPVATIEPNRRNTP